MAKKKEITKQEILSFYIDYFLEHNKQPTSVYLFAKHYIFDESLFYKKYASFDQIEKDFFNSLFTFDALIFSTADLPPCSASDSDLNLPVCLKSFK